MVMVSEQRLVHAFSTVWIIGANLVFADSLETIAESLISHKLINIFFVFKGSDIELFQNLYKYQYTNSNTR